MSSVYILSGVRSPVGSFGGSLRGTSPIDLGTHVAKEAITRSGFKPKDLDHAVIGQVIHTEPRDMYISRCVGLGAGMGEASSALTVNRLCGSGLQAITSAAQLIMLGDATMALAGGVEVMSRSGHLIPSLRWGSRMGDAEAHDMMLGALHDPFGLGHMGITAENIASAHKISRKEQDAFAVRSQERAAAAIKAGYFKEQITPISIKERKKSQIFDTDEHVRGDTTLESLADLPSIFQKNGSVTAGNASGINDGAAMLILASEEVVAKHAKKPLAKIIGYGFGGVDPKVMGLGPIPATKKALKKAGLEIDDLQVVESNEAFAAQACAVSKELGIKPDIVNPNGGAIALGHPIGATGAIIMVKLIYELHRINGRYGMATMCIGGGQGISVIIEAVS